jgi:DNA-binding transcriptional regulator YdaS (Cro superfamily)
MSIDEWLTAHKFTAARLAQMLRCSPSALSSWRAGRCVPSSRLMARIERVTRGEVRPEDFDASPQSPTE